MQDWHDWQTTKSLSSVDQIKSFGVLAFHFSAWISLPCHLTLDNTEDTTSSRGNKSIHLLNLTERANKGMNSSSCPWIPYKTHILKLQRFHLDIKTRQLRSVIITFVPMCLSPFLMSLLLWCWQVTIMSPFLLSYNPVILCKDIVRTQIAREWEELEGKNCEGSNLRLDQDDGLAVLHVLRSASWG